MYEAINQNITKITMITNSMKYLAYLKLKIQLHFILPVQMKRTLKSNVVILI